MTYSLLLKNTTLSQAFVSTTCMSINRNTIGTYIPNRFVVLDSCVMWCTYTYVYLLEWNILANPVIWLVNQAGDMSPYPRSGARDMDIILFCKMASHHLFIFLLILKKKLQVNAQNNLFVQYMCRHVCQKILSTHFIP